MPNVGINGFCRIGRVVLRTCLENSNMKVTAINDPAIDIEYMCYLIKFDSTHGKFKDGEVVMRKNHDEIQINDTIIKIFHEKSPAKIPWHLANVQYVVEASGMFTTVEKASGHMSNNGVEHVIVTAPSVNIPMLILGVNEDNINSDNKVVSSASSTLYCLAPIIKVLEDNFGVSEGFITSIHAMTPSLKPLDGMCLRGKYWRDHRSIHQNIIPASTGACKALGKILPSVKDKLTGTAFRVPIVNVSVLDLTIRLNTPTTISDIMLAVAKNSDTKMKNIIRITNEEAVSSDFMNDSFSCIVDVGSSIQLRPNFFKLICWYENEYSYACRVIDTIKFISKINNPIRELNNRVSATTFHNKTRGTKDYGSPTRRKLAILKRESSGTSQENAYKSKTRIPQKVFGKNKSDSTIVTEKLEQVPKNHYNHGTYVLDDSNLKPNVDNSKVSNQGISEKTIVKTMSTVKIFQAQQERLEKVKKEFDKVASFTEDLLNKTKMFNDTLLSLSNESLNATKKKDIQKMPNDALSNLTYVKSAVSGKENVDMRSSECSEEVKNWNLEDFKESALIQSVNENDSTTENQTDSLEKLPKNPDCFQKIPLTVKHCLVSGLGNREQTKEGNDKNPVNDFKADYNMEDTTSAESCYNNVTDKSSGQVYDTMSHEVNYQNFNENKTYDNCEEQLNESLRNLQSVSKISSIEAETLNSKMEISKDLNDLYDKLDSVSNTCSESSFKEKKSQIIQFADLSHSMEELDKLDQFCRIIEISDEISDHLFAALKNNNATVPKGEWSFGDLCKRLNLEEFCKKMFQKPNV